MGLMIIGYGGLTAIEPIDPDVEDDELKFWQAKSFEGWEGSLDLSKHYEHAEKAYTGNIGYTGFMQFREELSKLAGYKRCVVRGAEYLGEKHWGGVFEVEEGPFWDLLCFSDSEGTIGPERCAKLHKDFVEFAERAEKEIPGRYGEFYKQIHRALDAAVIGMGCLAFR